jgi:hypothetical protein
MTCKRLLLYAVLIFLAASFWSGFQGAKSQTLDATAGSQAIAIVGGSGSGNNRQTIRTNPDAIAPPAMTAQGSCFVGDGAVAIGGILGSITITRTVLDEGCEARADSEAFLRIAAALVAFGDLAGAKRNLDLAQRRLTATRLEYQTAVEDDDQPWPPLWRP